MGQLFSPSSSPFSLRINPYSERLKHLFKNALCENFGPDKPHALTLIMHEDKPRLIDFSAWRYKGSGSHQSHTISVEAEPIRDALSIAAFDIGNSGGFIGSMPRSYRQPAYYFLTHAIIGFDRLHMKKHEGVVHRPKDLGDILYTAQAGGTSGHMGLKAAIQIKTVLETVCRGQLDLTEDD